MTRSTPSRPDRRASRGRDRLPRSGDGRLRAELPGEPEPAVRPAHGQHPAAALAQELDREEAERAGSDDGGRLSGPRLRPPDRARHDRERLGEEQHIGGERRRRRPAGALGQHRELREAAVPVDADRGPGEADVPEPVAAKVAASPQPQFGSTATRSPGAIRVTPDPTATTTPMNSWPGHQRIADAAAPPSRSGSRSRRSPPPRHGRAPRPVRRRDRARSRRGTSGAPRERPRSRSPHAAPRPPSMKTTSPVT